MYAFFRSYKQLFLQKILGSLHLNFTRNFGTRGTSNLIGNLTEISQKFAMVLHN